MMVAVSESVRARAVLMFSDRHFHSAQPVLRCDQETRMSASGRRQTIHGPLLKGLLYAPC